MSNSGKPFSGQDGQKTKTVNIGAKGKLENAINSRRTKDIELIHKRLLNAKQHYKPRQNWTWQQ